MLRVYNIFKLPQISHIAVGEDISPQIPVDDILFVFAAVIGKDPASEAGQLPNDSAADLSGSYDSYS